MQELILKFLTENPDALIPIISEYANKYKGVLYALCSELFSVYKDFVNNDEYFKIAAEKSFKDYASLVNAGFTTEQAMDIILREKNQSSRNIAKSINSLTATLQKAQKNM